MKIAICGNLIETENIYKITETKFSEACLDHPFYEGCYSNGFSFDILMFGKTSITIGLPCYTYVAHNHIKDKVNKLRDEVIKEWSNNQSYIPKIDFI